MSEKWVGAHVSAAGGVFNAPVNEAKIGGTALGLFTKNQRQWKAKPLQDEVIQQFKEECENRGFSRSNILPHASYLINPGAPESEKLEKSREALLDEMQRCEQLGIGMLNFHPGSHLKKSSPEECISVMADTVNYVLDKTEHVMAVLENTAGQGTNMGWHMEHLTSIMEQVDDKSRVGVCIDTCHAHAAGYDFTSEKAYEKTMEDILATIGEHKLVGLHLNDAKAELNSRKDRHAPIGKGTMGELPFRLIMNDDRLNRIPMILETPEPENWALEIDWLKKQIGTL